MPVLHVAIVLRDRVLEAMQRLGVELEGLTDEFRDSVTVLASVHASGRYRAYPQTTTSSNMLPHNWAIVALSLLPTN